MNVEHQEKFHMYEANAEGYTGIDYLPQQLLNRMFLFYPLEEDYKPVSGRFGKLEEGDELYQLTEPVFAEYLWENGGRCGVAMGYGGLVAVVLHDPKYLWAVFNRLGPTCSMYDREQDKVILFYKVYDTCPPNMDFVDIGEGESETVTPLRQRLILDSLESPPVFSLMAQSYYMELNDPETTDLPIRSMQGVGLFDSLCHIASPLPWVKTRYVDGIESYWWDFADEVLEKHGIRND